MRFVFTLALILTLLPISQILWASPGSESTSQPDAYVWPLQKIVMAENSTLRMADLVLGLGQPQDRQRTCLEIALGRSPQPGSVRIFERVQIVQRVREKHPECKDRFLIPDHITVLRAGWRIHKEILRHAIEEFLAGLDGSRDYSLTMLRWPAQITTRTEQQNLRIRSMQWDVRRQAMQFAVDCVPQEMCGSFLAEAQFSNPIKQETQNRSTPAWATQAPFHHGTSIRRAVPSGPIMARSGTQATLVMEEGGIKISLPVTCLERGVLGQRIRVLDKGRHRVFAAEVIGADLLRSTF